MQLRRFFEHLSKEPDSVASTVPLFADLECLLVPPAEVGDPEGKMRSNGSVSVSRRVAAPPVLVEAPTAEPGS